LGVEANAGGKDIQAIRPLSSNSGFFRHASSIQCIADDVCMPMMNQLSATVLLFFLLGSISAQNSDAPTALKMGQTGANTFVGMVSDSSCGPRHKMMDKSAEECARTCQRAGASYVLVAGEKIYTLAGRANDLAYLAGQKVKVTGSARGNTISVAAVAPIR
jgi:hypothetical protein